MNTEPPTVEFVEPVYHPLVSGTSPYLLQLRERFPSWTRGGECTLAEVVKFLKSIFFQTNFETRGPLNADALYLCVHALLPPLPAPLHPQPCMRDYVCGGGGSSAHMTLVALPLHAPPLQVPQQPCRVPAASTHMCAGLGTRAVKARRDAPRPKLRAAARCGGQARVCQDAASAGSAWQGVAGALPLPRTVAAAAPLVTLTHAACVCVRCCQAMQYMQDKMDGTLDEAVLASREAGSRTRRTASASSMGSPARRALRGRASPGGSPVVHHTTARVSGAKVRASSSDSGANASAATGADSGGAGSEAAAIPGSGEGAAGEGSAAAGGNDSTGSATASAASGTSAASVVAKPGEEASASAAPS